MVQPRSARAHLRSSLGKGKEGGEGERRRRKKITESDVHTRQSHRTHHNLRNLPTGHGCKLVRRLKDLFVILCVYRCCPRGRSAEKHGAKRFLRPRKVKAWSGVKVARVRKTLRGKGAQAIAGSHVSTVVVCLREPHAIYSVQRSIVHYSQYASGFMCTCSCTVHGGTRCCVVPWSYGLLKAAWHRCTRNTAFLAKFSVRTTFCDVGAAHAHTSLARGRPTRMVRLRVRAWSEEVSVPKKRHSYNRRTENARRKRAQKCEIARREPCATGQRGWCGSRWIWTSSSSCCRRRPSFVSLLRLLHHS